MKKGGVATTTRKTCASEAFTVTVPVPSVALVMVIGSTLQAFPVLTTILPRNSAGAPSLPFGSPLIRKV